MKKLSSITLIIICSLSCMEPDKRPEIKGSLIAPLRKLALKKITKEIGKLEEEDLIVAQLKALEGLPSEYYFLLTLYIFLDPSILLENKKKIINKMVEVLKSKKIQDPKILFLSNLLKNNAIFLKEKGTFVRGINSLVQVPAKSAEAKTLLHLAIEMQNLPLVSVLLEEGADPNLGINYSQQLKDMPIILAIQNGNVPIVRLISEHTQLPKISPKSIRFHPLIIAAKTGNKKIVQSLLDKRFSLNTIYQLENPQTILDIVWEDLSFYTLQPFYLSSKINDLKLKNIRENSQAHSLLIEMGAKKADELK